ncbi:uncharacterized protein RAG0_00558 [Rhynchosporium agropyri]|uniref:Uncharacterized protein n=1 Tax=Rhynchosporium agropyri TaxID=914238 RepID=A0A1E1JTS4_9HELO|nr:uncharacterized protein RAG0_00558 [Rhynchosporium agropyri]
MLGGTSRVRGQAPVTVPQYPSTSPESFSWRPALRKIKSGLFSKSATPENSDTGKPKGPCTATGRSLLEIHQQCLNERNARRQDGAPQSPTSPGPYDGQNFTTLRDRRSVLMGPTSPKDLTTFSRIKRLSIKSSSGKTPPHSPREPIFVMRDIGKQEVEIISAGAPQTVTSPRTLASGFRESLSSEEKILSSISSQEPVLTKSPTTSVASQPQPAAADSAKLNLPFDLDFNGLAQPPSSTKSDRSSSESPSKRPSDAEIDDYQRFISTSRQAAGRSYNSHVIMNSTDFTPQTSAMMQEIFTNNQTVGRDRGSVYSRRSTASRPASRPGSIFDRVTDYVKPQGHARMRSQGTGRDRSESMGSARTGLTSVDDVSVSEKPSALDLRSTFEEEEAEKPRRFRRPFSLDLSKSGYEACDAVAIQTAPADGLRRRSKGMPLSPGMKKFQKAVKEGRVGI